MHVISSLYNIILIITIGMLFSGGEPSHFWDIVMGIIVFIIIIALFFKPKNSDNKPENMTAEEKQRQEIKEWSRRNRC